MPQPFAVVIALVPMLGIVVPLFVMARSHGR
jgi:hypothetical protein